jgi:hypothetical protein
MTVAVGEQAYRQRWMGTSMLKDRSIDLLPSIYIYGQDIGIGQRTALFPSMMAATAAIIDVNDFICGTCSPSRLGAGRHGHRSPAKALVIELVSQWDYPSNVDSFCHSWPSFNGNCTVGVN